MPWYYDATKNFCGRTLVEVIDALQVTPQPAHTPELPLRMPVSRCIKVEGTGTVAIGRVATGTLIDHGNKTLLFCNNGQRTGIQSVQTFWSPVKTAKVGDRVGIHFPKPTRVTRRGDVIGYDKTWTSPKVCRRFLAQIVITARVSQKGIRNGYTPTLHIHTATVPCRFNTIIATHHRKSLKVIKSRPETVHRGHVCSVVMVPLKPVCVETFAEFGRLGRIVMRDCVGIVACGIVTKVQVVEEEPEPTTDSGLFSHDDDEEWADIA